MHHQTFYHCEYTHFHENTSFIITENLRSLPDEIHLYRQRKGPTSFIRTRRLEPSRNQTEAVRFLLI